VANCLLWVVSGKVCRLSIYCLRLDDISSKEQKYRTHINRCVEPVERLLLIALQHGACQGRLCHYRSPSSLTAACADPAVLDEIGKLSADRFSVLVVEWRRSARIYREPSMHWRTAGGDRIAPIPARRV